MRQVISHDQREYERLCQYAQRIGNQQAPSWQVWEKTIRTISNHQGITEIGRRNSTGGV